MMASGINEQIGTYLEVKKNGYPTLTELSQLVTIQGNNQADVKQKLQKPK